MFRCAALVLGLLWHCCLAAASCDVDACIGGGEGEGFFRTIGAALAAGAGQTHWRVAIAPGEYREKLVIDQPGVELLGAGRERTVIHYDAYAGQGRPDGEGNWTTWASATVIVRAPDFTARGLTIANRFDYPTNDALPADHPDKIRDSQGVALMVDRGGDRVLLEDVALEGFQDTLFLLSGRTLVRDSRVSGVVDFIFGAGTGVFIDSEIRTRTRGARHHPHGYITAPSTDLDSPYGLVFIDCRLTREPGVADGSVSLGRPWHPTRDFADGRYADPRAVGAAVFIRSWMDAHVSPEGWSSMGGRARDGSRVQFPPGDARFFEYASEGPGERLSESRRQLRDSEADRYMLERVLGDWRPRIPQPLPREPRPYSPRAELAKHGPNWPGLALAVAEPGPGVKVMRDQVYARRGGDPLQADLFMPYPIDDPRPAVVLVHGGGWRSGERQYLEHVATGLARAGYVAATIDYRLSRQALFPAALEDVRQALGWLRREHRRFGLDPDRVALLGASAGAHLATLAAVTEGPSRVQALVNLDGVVDMVSPEARHFEDRPDKPSLFGLWIGGRYADYPALWRQASPMQQLGGTAPPTLFLNSAKPRFRVGREMFLARLASGGIAHDSHVFDDSPHTFWLFQRWFDPTMERVLVFLGEQL